MGGLDELRQLIESEIARKNFKDGHPRLLRRRGLGATIPNSDRLTELPIEEQRPLQDAWYAFHESIHHKTYSEFFSKVECCLRLSAETIDIDTFFYLIADRTFLFLEFCESGNDPSYPPFSLLVQDLYANSKGYPDESVNRVLNEIIIPTAAYKGSHQVLLENYRELIAAKQMRERQVQTPPRFDSFTIKISPSETAPLSDLDQALSNLFYGYYSARVSTRYSGFEKFLIYMLIEQIVLAAFPIFRAKRRTSKLQHVVICKC